MSILELRILPPLAIARLGSSPEPLENYELCVDDPLGYRRIEPAETLRVDPASGAVVEAYKPANVRFRDDLGRIHPVAPFFEVYARTSEDVLEPLTPALLESEKLAPRDLRWTVTVANIKAFRRTADKDDRIVATANFNDHASHALEGKCPNLLPGKSLPLGSARYIKPTTEFPEVRLRYTPAAGLVYGASRKRIKEIDASGRPVVEDDPVIGDRIVYDENKGKWKSYFDKGVPSDTNPGAIYAGYSDPTNGQTSWGYLDDECDGIASVELSVRGKTLRAFARLGAGPPSFAPDGLPIRTVSDELEQAMCGPEVAAAQVSASEVEEIVRRAFETVRLLNTAVMNGNPVNGRLATASMMPAQDTNDYHRRFEPIMATMLVDNLSVVALHQAVLTALKGGTPAWFADVLRHPEDIGDLSDKGRRKMPAMMRGADARYLTLTRRQIDKIRKSAARGLFR
jgi:hypothetical protein